MEIDKKQFWENKIETWEKKRYGQNPDSSDRNVDGFCLGASLQYRLRKTVELISQHVTGKRILEVGCGSGFLFRDICDLDFASYLGIDLASNAIENKNKLVSDLGLDGKASFITADIMEQDLSPFDLIIGLGVLDWLSLKEIEVLFNKIAPRNFLFSFSERTFSFSRYLHLVYVFLTYGWKTGGYIPQYYSYDELFSITKNIGYKNVSVHRDKHLSFGALLFQLQ